MSMRSSRRPVACLGIAVAALATESVHAEMSTEQLAKLAQNPVGNLISVPFQNNSNFNYGPLEKTQNILNIQPVYPIHVSDEWNIITRTIFPLLWQPALYPGEGSTFGLSDTQFSAFLSPAQPKGLIWGVGGIAQLPITTANWQSDSDDTWTVPIGGGVGKIFHLGKLPVNSQISAYYNVETPKYGPDWQLRPQVQFMFPD